MMTASFGMTKKPNHVEWFWNIGKKNAIYRNFCRTKRTRLTTKGPCAMDQNGPNSGRDRAADALVKTFETFIFEGTWKDGDPLPPALTPPPRPPAQPQTPTQTASQPHKHHPAPLPFRACFLHLGFLEVCLHGFMAKQVEIRE